MMTRTMWIPKAVHSYYLQDVKRRSSVMRSRPVNPNMPDGNLLIYYKDVIGKNCHELLEMIDPNFQQLARIEKLQEMLVTDGQPDKAGNYSGAAKDSEAAKEKVRMDMPVSMQFANEIRNQLPNNATVEVNAAPSPKITKMSQEEVDITFEIMQEIITRETEEAKKIKEEKEREEKENEVVIMEEPAPNPAANPVPDPVPNAVPQRANRRPPKIIIMEEAVMSAEIEVLHDGVSNSILLKINL